MVTARAPTIDFADLKCCGLTPAPGRAGSGRGAHEEAPITSGRPSPCGRGRCAACCGWAGRPICGRPDAYTVVRAPRAHPALRNLAVSVAAVRPPGWCASPAVSHHPRKPQRPPAARALDAAVRLAHTPDDDPAHDWAGQAPDAAAAWRTVPPVRVHPRPAGLHVTGRQPPVPIGARPGLRQLQPSPRPRQSRPCRSPSSKPLGGVARRSDTNEKVAADFQRIGTCHRKGESAVGVSTDSATPTI